MHLKRNEGVMKMVEDSQLPFLLRTPSVRLCVKFIFDGYSLGSFWFTYISVRNWISHIQVEDEHPSRLGKSHSNERFSIFFYSHSKGMKIKGGWTFFFPPSFINKYINIFEIL